MSPSTPEPIRRRRELENELYAKFRGLGEHVRDHPESVRKADRPVTSGPANPRIVYPWGGLPVFAPGSAMVMVAGEDDHEYVVVILRDDVEVSRADVLGLSAFWPGTAAPSLDDLMDGDTITIRAQEKHDPDNPMHGKAEVVTTVIRF